MSEVGGVIGRLSNDHNRIFIRGADSGQRSDKRPPVIRSEDLEGVEVISSSDQQTF